ncbi:F-box only protein 8-like [Capsicum galapagoense]
MDVDRKAKGRQKKKKIVESSNDNTADQMDVDRAATDHLQEEILMDILSRLPVWSLLQFKCVSSIWKTLISDSYFTVKHLNRAKNDQGSQKLLITQMCFREEIFSMYCCPLSPAQLVDENVQKLKLDCPSNPKLTVRCKILCLYDGLAVIRVTDTFDRDLSTVLLWNPSTRESMVLPLTEFSDQPIEYCFGLGYDYTSGEYKILPIYQDFNPFCRHRAKLPNEILTLTSGYCWRRIAEYPRRGICSLVWAMDFLAFIHATFHWIGISSNHFEVVSFSISNEAYGEMPLSEEILSLLMPGHYSIGVCVLGGMLCVHSSISVLHDKTMFFKFWVMKEYGVEESWMSLLTVDSSCFVDVKLKYMFPDGEVLYLFGALELSGSAFWTRNAGPFRLWPITPRT